MAENRFYEWQTDWREKVAHHFAMTDGSVFAFAGLMGDGPQGEAVATITTEPNELVARVHDRMPVILPTEHVAAWLDPRTGLTALSALLRPYPADRMTVKRVGKAVGNARNEGPQCLEPAGPAQLSLF